MEIKILDWIQTLHTPVGDTAMCLITKLGDAGIFWILLTLVLLILNMFTRIPLLYLLALVPLGYGYFRMFSRNISKRSSENYAYLQKTERIRAWFGKMKRRIVQSRDYHIYKCPSCGQKIRVPRGKGKICITCPKCRKEFEKRS